jgi:hypothetical protein
MTLDQFRREATRVWDEIPDDYRSGVDGLVIETGEQAHPSIEDIYTLGECLTEAYPSPYGGPDTTRSVLVLYYGSFRRLSGLDPEFDWKYEIWETITHELRHHLESLAAEDALEDVDYAMDENFKRLHGDPFDPYFYRAGEPIGPGVYAAEQDVFVELEYGAGDPRAPEVEVEWRGRLLAVPVPDEPGDITFIQVVGGLEPDDPELCLVLVRRQGWVRTVRRWLSGESLDIVQAEAEAEVVEPDDGEGGGP